MKNIGHENLLTSSRVLRMLVREIIKERIDIDNKGLEYASIGKNPLKTLDSVQILLDDTVLIVTPVIQSLDELGLKNMVAGADIENHQRPLVMFKLSSRISVSQIQATLRLNGELSETLETPGRSVDFGDILYDANDTASLTIDLKGFIEVDRVVNNIDSSMSITNLIDPNDIQGDEGYIVELLFDIKKETVKFTPGKIMPAQNTYAAVHANPGAYDVKISPIGMRMHPIDKVPKMHYGQDITRLSARTLGQDIVAVLPGEVIESGSRKGFGNTIAIKHDAHDNIATRYSHMQNVSDKSVGSRVSIGEVIGKVGNTGMSSGPHLHFTVFGDVNTYSNETTAGNPPDILANYPTSVFPIAVEMPKK